jgi:hypothetical protein
MDSMAGMGFTSETGLSFAGGAKQAAKELQATRGRLQPSDISGHVDAFQECRTRVLASYRTLVYSNVVDAMVLSSPTCLISKLTRLGMRLHDLLPTLLILTA